MEALALEPKHVTGPLFLPTDQQAALTARALELRADGLSYAKIGEALGISEATAWRWIMGTMMSQVANSADKVRARQAELIIAAINALWPMILNGDSESIRTMNQLLGHEAKLFGSFAPDQSVVRQTLEVVPPKAAGVLDRIAESDGIVLDGELADPVE